jgi:hypothetical protein
MEANIRSIHVKPQVYQFGPVFKTGLVLASVAMVAAGIWGMANAYTHFHTVLGQFGGILLSLIPVAAALIGAPMVWRCRLTLHEDRLVYNGLVIDAVIRKSDVIDALTPAPHYGMFHILLTLVRHPVKKLHIAVLGRMDDALARWVGALPHQTQKV